MLMMEHIDTAKEFLEESDHYFSEGDVLQGSEKTWGAAAHAVMGIAQRRGWPYGTHRSLNIAVRRLADEHDDPSLEPSFGVAEKFHANFYHKFMEDFEYESGRRAVRQLVKKVQSFMDAE